MNIQHLKYAVEVYKTGSISQAAENLYMGQPNLSKTIKELETTLGISIFKRTSKGVIPTEKGEEFFVFAKKILSQYDEMISHYKQENKKQSFSISVPRGSYITNAFTRFIKSLDYNKEIDINFNETSSMKAVRNIVENGYRLGIIRYNIVHERHFIDYLEENDLAYVKIFEFEHLVLMSELHPLANNNEVLYSNLDQYIEIIHGDRSIPYLSKKEKEDNRQNEKKVIRLFERGSQFDILTHIPTTYMWASPVPLETIELYKLVQRKCNVKDNIYKDVLIYPKGYKLKKIDNAFIEKLYEVKNEISQVEYY
ncbi:MAG: LysR family transcriptional regulator [Clostridiaceae bacterium]|nr:LysR family transcriptional regulator [Clostridiaceae bacterium]